MKVLTITSIIISGVFFMGFNFQQRKLENIIQFSSKEKAKELLTTEDSFTKSWSQFDIDSRLQKRNSKKEELFEYISGQILDWTTDEKNKITYIVKKIDKNIIKNEFKLDFPSELYFVKTTGKEEGNATGYTRLNYIVLKENILAISENELKQTITHELFHILTRNNKKFKVEMYKLIGFQLMNEVAYPDNIKNLRITNPDAPEIDSYIELNYNEKPIECTMILYSKDEYSGGDFFKYLKVGFLKLKGTEIKTVEYENGLPIIYSYNDFTNFTEKVGNNTKYIIHPEEILADNFSFVLLNQKNLPSKWLIEKMRTKLKQQ